MIVKTNDDKFVRDEASNVLINTDIDAYKQYKQARLIEKQFKTIEKRVEFLEKQLQIINEKLKLE